MSEIPHGAACRHCGATALTIEWRPDFQVAEVGSFALSGHQMKFSATHRLWPWMVCGGCGAESRGKVA